MNPSRHLAGRWMRALGRTAGAHIDWQAWRPVPAREARRCASIGGRR